MIYWCPFTETHQCNSECVFLKKSEEYISDLNDHIHTYSCLLAKAAEGLTIAFSDINARAGR